MKSKLNFFAALLLISNVGLAQTDSLKQTLINGKINKVGVVASVFGQYSGINGSYKPSSGGSFSFLFNEKFAVGLSGFQFYNPNKVIGSIATRAKIGGLQLEYNTNPNKVVHFSFPLLIGVGSASRDSISSTSSNYNRGGKGHRYSDNWNYSRNNHRPNFGVIQPGINVEVNLLKNVAVFGGLNYRIAVGSTSSTLSNKDLSGLGIQAGLKVGLFGVPVSKLKIRKSKEQSDI